MTKQVSSKKSVKNGLESKIEELTSDLQRVHADFVNYRRRSENEQSQIMDTAKQSVVAKLLPLIDNLERAASHIPRELQDNSWATGVLQILNQAERVFRELGVERIPAKGKPFDPRWHEAIGFEEGKGTQEVVTAEIQRGYKIGDQVIRPSMVKVGRK